MSRSPAAAAMVASIGIFVLSLPLTAFSYATAAHTHGSCPGYEAAGLGVFAVVPAVLGLASGHVDEAPMLAWLANPCLLAAWIAAFANWRRGAVGFALAAAAFALMFAFADRVQMTVDLAEHITLNAGYGVWFVAILCAVGVAWRMEESAQAVPH